MSRTSADCKQPCQEFKPQLWRRDRCQTCFFRERDHLQSAPPMSPRPARSRTPTMTQSQPVTGDEQGTAGRDGGGEGHHGAVRLQASSAPAQVQVHGHIHVTAPEDAKTFRKTPLPPRPPSRAARPKLPAITGMVEGNRKAERSHSSSRVTEEKRLRVAEVDVSRRKSHGDEEDPDVPHAPVGSKCQYPHPHPRPAPTPQVEVLSKSKRKRSNSIDPHPSTKGRLVESKSDGAALVESAGGVAGLGHPNGMSGKRESSFKNLLAAERERMAWKPQKDDRGLLRRLSIWRVDTKVDSGTAGAHCSMPVETSQPRFNVMFGDARPSESEMGGYYEEPVAWLRVSILSVAIDNDRRESELGRDPVGVRVRVGPFELPSHVIMAPSEERYDAVVNGSAAGGSHSPGSVESTPPSAWLFPVSRTALEVGGMEVVVLHAYTRLPIGWIGIPLRGLTFVHNSVMYGLCNRYQWTPVFGVEGSLRVGLKLVKCRSMSSVRGHWLGASAGGSLDHISWPFSPQYAFNISLQSVVSLSLTSSVAIEHAAGFYLLKLRKPVEDYANLAPLTDQDLDKTTDRYHAWLRSGAAVIDVEVFLPAGTFVVVVCTQKRGIEGSFSFALSTDAPERVPLIALQKSERRRSVTPGGAGAAGAEETNSQSSSSQPTRFGGLKQVLVEDDSESDFEDCFVGLNVETILALGPSEAEKNEGSGGAGKEDDDDEDWDADLGDDGENAADEWAESEESKLFLERLAAASAKDGFEDFDEADWETDFSETPRGEQSPAVGATSSKAPGEEAGVMDGDTSSGSVAPKTPDLSVFSESEEDWSSGFEDLPPIKSGGGSGATSRGGSAINGLSPPQRRKAPDSLFSNDSLERSPRADVISPRDVGTPPPLSQELTRFQVKKRQSIRPPRRPLKRLSSTEVVLNSDQMGALQFAASHNHTSNIRHLLDRGTAVDTADDVGRTALMFAAMYGHRDCLLLLLERGADAHLVDNHRRSALSYAAACGSITCTNLLLEKGVSVAQRDRYGQTPVLRAVLRGHSHVVQRLFACESLDGEQQERLANDQDRFGNTPLLGAAVHGLVSLTRELLRVGADPSRAEKHRSLESFNKYLYHATILGNTAVAAMIDAKLGGFGKQGMLSWLDAPHVQEAYDAHTRGGRRSSSTRLRSGTIQAPRWAVPVGAKQWEWCSVYLGQADHVMSGSNKRLTRTHTDMDVVEILRFSPESDAYILWTMTAVGGTPLSACIICEDPRSELGPYDEQIGHRRSESGGSNSSTGDSWSECGQDMQEFFELEWRSMLCVTEKLALDNLLPGMAPLSAFKVVHTGVLGSDEFRNLFTDVQFYDTGSASDGRSSSLGSEHDQGTEKSEADERGSLGQTTSRILTLPFAVGSDFASVETHMDHISKVHYTRVELSDHWWRQQDTLEAQENPTAVPTLITEHSPKESTVSQSCRVAGYVMRKRALDRGMKLSGARVSIGVREALHLERLIDSSKSECHVQIRIGSTCLRTSTLGYKRKKRGANTLVWNQAFAVAVPSIRDTISVCFVARDRTLARVQLVPLTLASTAVEGCGWYALVPESAKESNADTQASLLLEYSISYVAPGGSSMPLSDADYVPATATSSDDGVGVTFAPSPFPHTPMTAASGSEMSALEKFEQALADA